MKKLILLLTIFIISLNSFGQDPNPDLFQTWYLYSIEFETGPPINVSGFDPPIAPDLTIASDLGFSGNGACNTFEGIFEFFPPNDFVVFNASNTTEGCGFFEDKFEVEYFGFFSDDIGMFSSITTESNGEQILVLHGSIFTTLTFKNVPVLSTPKFNSQKISIFPNPTASLLFITSEGGVVESIAIYNLAGQLVLEQMGGLTQIDVSTLNRGIFFVELTSAAVKTVQKFIKL